MSKTCVPVWPMISNEKKMEFAHAISPLENPMSIRSLRRDIARLKTALESKQQQA